MNINIDYTLRTPIYEQIIKEIERLTTLGLLQPEQQIPSVRTLAYNLGINPNTVKKAYDYLEEKKVIETKSTKGTFISKDISWVKENKTNEIINQMIALMKELENYGLTKEEILKKLP